MRRRPITAVVPKALLPILNTPLLDYAIAECASSLTAVVYSDDLIAKYLRATQPHIRMIRQASTDGYGSSVPLQLAADFISCSLLYYVAVDDVVMCPSGSLLSELLEAKANSGAAAVIAARLVDARSATQYGVLDFQEDGTLVRIREKPDSLSPGDHQIYLGRVLADPSLLDIVRTLKPVNGELRVTDAINEYARLHRVLVHQIDYDYYDCGGIKGWMAANTAAAMGSSSAPDQAIS